MRIGFYLRTVRAVAYTVAIVLTLAVLVTAVANTPIRAAQPALPLGTVPQPDIKPPHGGLDP